MNKTRTIVTIIGIILSLSLITIVAGIASSAWQSDIQAMIQMYGDYDICFFGEFDQEAIRKIEANRNVRDVYSAQSVGLAKNDAPKYSYRPYIKILGIKESVLAACNMKIAEGRFPQNENELLLSPDLAENRKVTYHIGDTVTMKMGKRYYKNPDGLGEMYFGPDGLTEGSEVSDDVFYSSEFEEFREEKEKTYTIVGILRNEGGFPSIMRSSYINAYTYSETKQTDTLYVRLTDASEGDYVKAIAQIVDADESLVLRSLEYNLSDTAAATLYSQIAESGSGVTYFSINASLLSAKGYQVPNGGVGMSIIILIVCFVLLVIMAASAFIIRNSFSISITEKTKLYGMLSSVGATPRQIRMNVFFEAAVLGLIGIPIGILVGVCTTAGLLSLCNSLLKDMLGGMELIFSLPWYVYAAAVVTGIGTILLSASSSAQRASRISPMEAIRSSKDIYVSKRKKEKSFKTPKLIKKMFGIGGSIAWKNMKRSRVQYRTTVISIIVSVAVYLTASAFVNYNIRELQSQAFYQAASYNMEVFLNRYQYSNGKEELISDAEFDRQLSHILSLGNINKRRLTISNMSNYQFKVKESDFSEEIKKNVAYLDNFKVDGQYSVCYYLMAVDDDTFEELCERKGKTYDECRNKAFVVNTTKIYAGDYSYTGKRVTVFENPDGIRMDGLYENYIYDENIEEPLVDEDGEIMENMKKTVSNVSVELAGAVPDGYRFSFYEADIPYIVVTMDWYRANVNAAEVNAWENINLAIDAENPNQLEEEFTDMLNEGEYTILQSFQNYAKMVNNLRSFILVLQIFVYGFILIISLIGVTNIFNTITTNMKLRQKEFAMLRSIGTTKREFNRMVNLECLLYTMKSLLIGVPLGLLGSYAICSMMNIGRMPDYQISYMFPWTETLICLFAVLSLLAVIMRFSVRKVNKMNIIETIRNDNI